MSPTQRTLEEMRRRGYLADVVERWLPNANVRRDLYGFIDVLCIVRDPTSELFRKDPVVAVQATSWSNVSARVRKIADHENIAAVRRAGIRVLVHGWKKNRDGRWTYREIDCS
jgi:hypothetical protein